MPPTEPVFDSDDLDLAVKSFNDFYPNETPMTTEEAQGIFETVSSAWTTYQKERIKKLLKALLAALRAMQ